MILPDWLIEQEIRIEPFSPGKARPGAISYGLSSYGYDLRLGRRFRVCAPAHGGVIDPKAFDPKAFPEEEGDVCVIPPNSFALAESVEWLEVPRDVLALCLGKSTYARCGIVVNATPLEPGWRGRVTLEVSNTTPLPAVVYAGEGICQVLFLRGEGPCRVSYADRRGKYQDQQGLTPPLVEGAP